jgi:diketogulonate reductase-like aldo/keto reductase
MEMNTKQLGNTGIQIPEVGYGTWKHQGDVATIRRALEMGAFLIDSAESYDTERYVGQAIAGNRKAYFLATKVSPSNFRYDDVLKAAEGSLRALGTDVIDLYQLHWPNYEVPIDETMRAMDKLVTDGKVRHIGVSNFSVDLLREAERALGEGRIVENQIKFSLLDHEFADEVIPYCAERGMTVFAYSSLEQGEFQDRVAERPQLAETLDRIGAELGKTRAQILLNWVICEPNVITIPMTNRVERVDENCGASGWRLSAEQRAELTEAAGDGATRRWWVS